MTRLQKITTTLAALLLFFPGIGKFFLPFRENFAIQIANAHLPFPHFSYFMGQAGEIVFGLLLFILLFAWKKFNPDIRGKLYVFANIATLFIMLVAIYVHLSPEVPASVLPPAALPAVLTTAAIINLVEQIRKKLA